MLRLELHRHRKVFCQLGAQRRFTHTRSFAVESRSALSIELFPLSFAGFFAAHLRLLVKPKRVIAERTFTMRFTEQPIHLDDVLAVISKYIEATQQEQLGQRSLRPEEN